MKPSRIMLFPLDVVLFPGMTLPLHIFEERYKLMVARCLREKAEFGIVLAGEKGIATAGCTARIQEVMKTYPDGRMDILTAGCDVYSIQEVIEEKEYYEADVNYLVEEPSLENSAESAELQQLFGECHEWLYGHTHPGFSGDTRIPLCYQIAARMPLQLEAKQALLEIRSEDLRRPFLLERLRELRTALASRRQLLKKAGGNGHGPN
ncbi:MAG TPA: LON peptidase substrate-binding domain-containing protein [Candidatus Acidoferrales bacterium]|jgi:Lon protease-like protein